MDNKFYINGRFLTQKVSGIQRMARSLTMEILKINKMHLNSILYIVSIALIIYVLSLFWRDMPNQKNK